MGPCVCGYDNLKNMSRHKMTCTAINDTKNLNEQQHSMQSMCVCGYASSLSSNLYRHKKSCIEHAVYTRTCDMEKELNLLRNNSILQQAKLDEQTLKIANQQAELHKKDEQILCKDQQIREKDEQIRKLENALIQKPATSYKNCTVNNTVNVCINAWGNETFDHITEEDKIRALRNYTTAIPNIVEQIHFGNERKNRNVKLPNKRGKEVLIYKELDNGEVKQVHEDLNEVLEDMIANGKYVLDPVAERLNMTRYKKFREDLRESERIKGKLYAEQKSAVKRKLMDNAGE